MSVRPFSPSESFAFPKPPQEGDRNSTLSRPPSSGTLNRPKSSGTLNRPKTDANPFDDPVIPPSPIKPEFAAVEAIRRPFVPTLHDEMSVLPGDHVKLVQLFDDGWVLVEKVPNPRDKKGKAKEFTSEQPGLIPIDCLRDIHQDLPTFLTSKRVSTYAANGASGVIAM
ncbi:hypothetical protein BD779DRAFT_1611590 [Infundibulicybe gibba]|nr:hypothetical protein BD779DRAFT_1611590 [Infundibulicybe gibba]